MTEEFNGRPLTDELRRLASKSIGDCQTVMVLAADAIQNRTPAALQRQASPPGPQQLGPSEYGGCQDGDVGRGRCT